MTARRQNKQEERQLQLPFASGATGEAQSESVARVEAMSTAVGLTVASTMLFMTWSQIRPSRIKS